MKLIRLKIAEQFRGLKSDFEITFRDAVKSKELLDFHPFCFAGLNGSGKSNVLEALSNIFYHLECIINNYPVFAYDAKESNPDTFELEYFIADENRSNSLETLNHIFIKKEKGGLPKLSVNDGEFIEISKSFGHSFMPDLVVAYSSGENETISLPYIKMQLFQYDQYIKDLKDKVEFQKSKSSLLYIDYEMSQAVLLTILLFFDFKDGQDKNVLSLLEEEIKISGIQQFSINIYNYWQKLVINENKELIEVETIFNIGDEDTKTNKLYIGRIIDNIQDFINKLKDCSTSSFEKENYTSFDFLVDENTVQLIRQKFNNDPYKFFSIFQILHSLNERVEENEHKYEVYNSKGYYTDYKRPEYTQFFYFTNYYIKKIGKNQQVTNLLLRQLSDGEQQFLHTLGICLMLQNKRVLLLLDEPETHFNPDWRSKFIDILRKTLEAGNDNFLFKDIVLTSHSPFIISDCYPDKVIVFESGKQPISAFDMNFRTFGTSVDIIMENIFLRNNTIGDFSAKVIFDIEKEIRNKKKLTEKQVSEYKNKTLELGDSMEKILLFAKLNELKKK
jgi:restriction system-associated AAA family ATPase